MGRRTDAGSSATTMRIRLISNHGKTPHWHDDTHAVNLEWARRLARYGVTWREVLIPVYYVTLSWDPPFEHRPKEEMAVALEDFPLSALAEFASDWDVALTLVPSVQLVWLEEGEPLSHALVLFDET